MRYGVGTWPEAFGNHRACVRVEQAADAVRVHIPWRRRDRDPERKHIQVVDSATGKEVANVARAAVAREAGDLVFQPATVPGEYAVYYLPFTVQPNWGGYGGDYLPPKATADGAWLERHGLTPTLLPQGRWQALPEARVTEIQARSEFERLDPMEVPATAAEMTAFLAAHPEPYLLFPEDRRQPIRMPDELPLVWLERGPATRFRGTAQPHEYYAFQLGLYAARAPIQGLALEASDLRTAAGDTIPAGAVRCANLGGTDWLGQPFRKDLAVPTGRVQALWVGVDVPRDAKAGDYRGTLTLRPSGAVPATVEVELSVAGPVLEDRGDAELWRHSRLRWLDSTLGLDDETVPPYTPLVVQEDRIACLGREVRLAPTGLPAGIRCGTTDLLAGPITLVVETATGTQALAADRFRLTRQASGRVVWEADAQAGTVRAKVHADMEADGHLQFAVALEPDAELAVRDIRLEMPLRREAATYLMGIGHNGGRRPAEWSWKWGGPVYYDSFWLGDVQAGVQCELRGASYCGPMVNLYWNLGQLKPPATWDNGGQGGCTVRETADGRVLATAFSGPRTLAPGQRLTVEFALLVTPVKPLDTAAHFRSRYYHDYKPVDVARQAGANIINIHHANELNPYINYPFLATDKLRAYVDEAHAKDTKVKIYYTVRELTNHIVEVWALRSLGHEVLAPGGGGGYPWLREHLVSDYAPSWYQHFDSGDVCASIVNSGASRWYNYYVEGLGWLVRHVGIDGLYLDDVSYDRTTLKRMRKVMDRARPGCLIDLHSNTAFSHGPANQYMEFFPYIDRLWFGESFNYDESPDYWLTEISGIPYGLMGEMLQNGGNRWRGMIYGMTARTPWCGDPGPIWKAWDEFGIADARMRGYWEPDCPVRTDHPDVLATAYVRPGRTLIAVASWAKAPVDCRLAVDWQALGLRAERVALSAPEIREFQPAAVFRPGDPIPVQPGRGWLLTAAEPAP